MRKMIGDKDGMLVGSAVCQQLFPHTEVVICAHMTVILAVPCAVGTVHGDQVDFAAGQKFHITGSKFIGVVGVKNAFPIFFDQIEKRFFRSIEGFSVCRLNGVTFGVRVDIVHRFQRRTL